MNPPRRASGRGQLGPCPQNGRVNDEFPLRIEVAFNFGDPQCEDPQFIPPGSPRFQESTLRNPIVSPHRAPCYES